MCIIIINNMLYLYTVSNLAMQKQQTLQNDKTEPKSDWVFAFELAQRGVRGRMVHLHTSLNHILHQHHYPTALEHMLSDSLTVTALVGHSMGQGWRLSLQIQSQGLIRFITTDYYAPNETTKTIAARIRAYSGFDRKGIDAKAHKHPPNNAFALLQNGYFAMLLYPPAVAHTKQPYQGLTPLTGQSIGDCASAYFDQSAQLSTRFVLAYTKESNHKAPNHTAVGLFVQKTPAHAHAHALDTNEQQDDWIWAQSVLATLTQQELLEQAKTPKTLLWRLFADRDVVVYPKQPIEFGCTCSVQRVQQSLSIYSSKDLQHMITDANTITADCQFCGAHYCFDADTLINAANKSFKSTE